MKEEITEYNFTPEDIVRIKSLNDFCAETHSKVETTKKALRSSVDDVFKAGTMLNAEHDLFVQRFGKQGGWVRYLSVNFPNIPTRTAYQWMGVAEKIKLTLETSQANADRHVMSQLELFPRKEYEEVEGDVTVPKLSSHLTIVNNWAKWYRPIQEGKQKLTPQQTTQLKADYKPLYEYLQKLYTT